MPPKSKKERPMRTPSGLCPAPAAYGNSIRSDAPLRSLSKKNLLRSPSFSDLADRDGTIEVLPALAETPESDRPALLRRQLKQASVAFDFTDATKNLPQKELKRQILVEILDYITENPKGVTVDLYPDFVRMIAANLFRALPPPSGPPGMDFDPDDDEPMLEEAWPHVQLVYEILLQFTVCDLDYKQARDFVDAKFIQRLLALFDSEDPREREYLKTALHRIYSKFLKHRVLIRRAINDVFHTVVYETGTHNGIAELLEILGSIINGFVVPIKAEHKQFLLHTLIPLHTVKSLNLFHSQLSYCVIQFVDKDPTLADAVVRGIARRFPRTNSPKALLILGEVETIVEITPHPVFVQYREVLAKLLARCLSSYHFQIAERTLAFFGNEYVRNLLEFEDNLDAILPIIFPPLYLNSREHWHSTVQAHAYSTLKYFMSLNGSLFQHCVSDYKRRPGEDRKAKEKRAKEWTSIVEIARKNDPTFKDKYAYTRSSHAHGGRRNKVSM